MNCRGRGLYNKLLANEISKYLIWKGAKTVAEKKLHSGIFMRSNEAMMEKEFCFQACPFNKSCTLTKK